MLLCSLSITYACPYHNPTDTMGHSIHNVDISKPLTHTTPYMLSAICPVQRKPGFIREENISPEYQTPLNVSICPSSRLTAVRSRPWWGRRACRWASLRRFLIVCAEILWLCKPIVAAAVRVAGLRWSWRWRCWMWRSWAGVVTRGLRLWGRLDVLPNSLKRLWRRLMVEKWTFYSRSTALVDIPAVSMSITSSLKTCDICGINWQKFNLCVCLPDEKMNLKHVHILESICITDDLSHPPATHPQLIRMYFLLHDPPDPRITSGPRGYNRHSRITTGNTL